MQQFTKCLENTEFGSKIIIGKPIVGIILPPTPIRNKFLLALIPISPGACSTKIVSRDSLMKGCSINYNMLLKS